MAAYAEIYWVQLKTQLAVQFQYRVAMLIWLIGMVIEPVMYLAVWSTVARYQGGEVGGFTAADFVAYYLLMMLVNHATFTWIMWEYEYRVRDGTLSALLLRPIHPIHGDIADNLAYKALTLTVLLPLALLLAWLFRASSQWQWWSLALFLPAVALAGAMRMLAEWTLAMAAFWTTRVNAINQVYFVALYFFSGWIAPLDLFPQFVQQAAYLLPFRWIIYFPIELGLGRLSPQQALAGLAAQVIWIGLLLLLLKLIWRAGVKRFSAVGA
ncbi:MAG TPA: ABC-2 family transporter protein [Caldilineaceae bacterium]|nr:ABC-2 family transporter protein [Caldilineaceae bacterium]